MKNKEETVKRRKTIWLRMDGNSGNSNDEDEDEDENKDDIQEEEKKEMEEEEKSVQVVLKSQEHSDMIVTSHPYSIPPSPSLPPSHRHALRRSLSLALPSLLTPPL
eukprot:512837-Hanusia_phi.AAC.1